LGGHIVWDPVLGHHVVCGASEAALSARPVVADKIDDERIVRVRQCADELDLIP
jgi:hypothetical protein